MSLEGEKGGSYAASAAARGRSPQGFFETGGTAAALQGGKRKRKRFFPLSSLFEGRTRPRICCLRLFSKIFFIFSSSRKKNILDLLLSRLLFRFRFRQRVIKSFSELVQSEFLSTEERGDSSSSSLFLASGCFCVHDDDDAG